jgi:hypothetical protein
MVGGHRPPYKIWDNLVLALLGMAHLAWIMPQ